MAEKEMLEELEKYIRMRLDDWKNQSGCESVDLDIQYGKELATEEILEYLEQLKKS